MQQCLIETSFSLLQPTNNLILQENLQLFVMSLVNIEPPVIKKDGVMPAAEFQGAREVFQYFVYTR